VATTTNSSRFLRIGRLLLAVCALSGFAFADGIDTIDAYGVDSTQGGGLWMYTLNTGTGQMGDVDAYFAGVIDITLDGDINRETLCVDLFTDIYIGTTYDTSVMMPSQVPSSAPEQDLLAVSWLIDNAILPGLYPGQFTSALPSAYWVSPAGSSVGTGAELGEALQFAIWKLTVDGGGSFTSGLVQEAPGLTDSLVLADAEYYEQAALGQATDNAYVYMNWSGSPIESDGTPAQMLEGPLYFDNGPAPVAPEPATFVLVGAALIGIGWSWRRQTRKHRSRPV
jgi:hypothetical protein